MKYVKQEKDGHIIAMGTNSYGESITKAEYDAIMETVNRKPTPNEGYDYKLKTDLTWEEFKIPTEANEDSE